MPQVRRNKQLMARNAASMTAGLAQLWGPQVGVVSIGLTLTEVYYTVNPWVTVSFLTQRASGTLSSDTIRRRLEELVDKGLVEFIEADGRRLFKATECGAEGTIALIEDALAQAPDNGFVVIARQA